jgi:hypothetical protein
MCFGTEMAAARREREELNPADFEFCCEYYVGPNPDLQELNGDFCQPADFDRREDMGKCDHCGTPHHWGVIFRDRRDGSYLVIGNVCASNFFRFESRRAYLTTQAAKLKASRERNQASRKAGEEFLAGRVELQAAFAECSHYIVEDIKAKLFKYGSISEKQAALVMKIAIEEAERTPEPTPEPIPEGLLDGRHEFSGEVLTLKWQDSMWGGGFKMLLRDDRGFKLWGTAFELDEEYVKGDRVAFMARVERSEDDPCFGFFSRPTKGQVIK